jgi:hypothetical protein
MDHDHVEVALISEYERIRLGAPGPEPGLGQLRHLPDTRHQGWLIRRRFPNILVEGVLRRNMIIRPP